MVRFHKTLASNPDAFDWKIRLVNGLILGPANTYQHNNVLQQQPPQQPPQHPGNNIPNRGFGRVKIVRRAASEPTLDPGFIKCQNIYNLEFVPAINKFTKLDLSPIRVRRQLALFAGMAGTYFSSNILHTAEEKLLTHSDMSLEERDHMIDKRLNDINKTFDLQKIINQVSSAKIQEIGHWLSHLNEVVTDLSNQAPEYSVVTSYIISKIIEKSGY